MTNKEIIKLILIMNGFDRNIKIDSFRGYDGSFEYEVRAESKDDEVYFCEPSFELLLYQMFNEFRNENNDGLMPLLIGVPIKQLLNDEIRETRIKEEDKRLEEIIKQSQFMKPFYKWVKENNPCLDCKINKKDHWDDIHYNCELCHTMQCKIMLKFHEERDKQRAEWLEKYKQYNISQYEEFNRIHK